MQPPSGFPTVSACRWLWESSPGVLLRAHTSLLLTLAPVALAIGPLPLFRCARTRLHLPRLPLRWLGFVARPLQGRLLGRSCRKGRRIDSSGFPSLWHATLLAVPRALSEVVGSRQSLLFCHSSRCLGTEVPLLPARYSVLGYYGPLRLPLSPLHPLAGLAFGSLPPHEFGSPVFLRISSVFMPSSLLRRTPLGLLALVVSSVPGPGSCPPDASLRPISTGSASALPFSKLAQRSLALRPEHFLSCSHSPFPAVLDRFCFLHQPSRWFRVER